jgi:hypothetical protein
MVALIVALFFTPYMAVAQCYTIGCRSFTQSSGGSSHTFSGPANSDQGNTCSGASCTITIQPTNTNDVLVLVTYTPSNVTISSISGCGTWVTGTNSNFSAYNSVSGAENAAYLPAATAACGSVTVTMSSAPSGTWDIVTDGFQVSPTSPIAAIDQLAATNTNSSSCTSTCTGSSFSGLTGTSDLIVQAVNDGSGASSPSSPYSWDSVQAFAYVLNSTATTAPTWTQTSGGFQTLGFAFK